MAKKKLSRDPKRKQKRKKQKKQMPFQGRYNRVASPRAKAEPDAAQIEALPPDDWPPEADDPQFAGILQILDAQRP